MKDKYYPEFCYSEDFCGESKCANVDLNTYDGCKECLEERIKETQKFLNQINEQEHTVYRAFFKDKNGKKRIVVGSRESIYALKELIKCETQGLTMSDDWKEITKIWN